MAEVEEQPRQSVQARIAALNLGQVGRGAGEIVHNVPEPPQRPAFDQRRKTANVPVQNNLSYSGNNGIGNEPDGPSRAAILPPPVITRTGQATSPSARPTPPPRLPPRKASIQSQPSPALPPRRPSNQLSRRDSNESISSVVSSISTMSALSTGTARTTASRGPSADGSRVKAPVYDPSTLPPLPPKRTKQEKDKELARIPLKGTKSSPSITMTEIKTPPPRTPTLPQRPAARDRSTESTRKLPPREPPPMPARSLHSPFPNDVHNQSQPNGIADGSQSNSTPPPIPISSRPDLSKLMATKPKISSTSQSTSVPRQTAITSCLKCRDFTAPDTHATKFPRQNVSSIPQLANQLTTPFPSPTDKARAIFTWLHHNVAYNTVAFFGGNIKPSTPASTLSSGLAVCEGYAALFHNLATHAGLESVVISGYGKGFGVSMSLAPGSPIPPYESNHAWNAVRIDGGDWKLLDACWGAGYVQGKDKPYVKAFKPSQFSNDNDVFGETHFPTDSTYFFRPDGSVLRWEDWIRGDQGGELAQVYSDIAPTEGLRESSFLPKYRRVPVSLSAHPSGLVRFQFERVCPHWSPLVQGHGEPFTYILTVEMGPDGHVGDYVPFETDGFFWWVDVDPRILGRPGAMISLYIVDTIDGRSGRGIKKEEYLRKKGRCAMGFKAVAAWDLV